MQESIENQIIANNTFSSELVEQLNQLKFKEKSNQNLGLTPDKFKQSAALEKALEAAIRIVKKTKSNSLTTTD